MSQSRTRFALTLLAAIALTPVAHAAPGDPLAEEFQVNTTGAINNIPLATAMSARGDFVVVWTSRTGDWSYDDPGEIIAQRYNAAGEPQGGEFRVVSATSYGSHFRPRVAMAADGDFVVTWLYYNGTVGYRILAQRYSADGTPQDGRFQVNTRKTLRHEHRIAMDADGNFVVTWAMLTDCCTHYEAAILAQRFDATGKPQGEEFEVFRGPPGGCDGGTFVRIYCHATAMDPNGDFVVAWEYSQEIHARRFNAVGEPQGDEFRVSTTYSAKLPSVAMGAGGSFVVAWNGWESEVSGWTLRDDVFARRYNALGEAQGGSLIVNTFRDEYQLEPKVAMDASGDFVVAWLGAGPGDYYLGDYYLDIFARRYTAAGEPHSPQFRVNTTTEDMQWYPAAAMDANGDFVIAWHSRPTTLDNANLIPSPIRAQRFQGKGHVEGDFDSDGRADILWRNAGTGNNVLWRMDGFARLDASSIGVAAGPWRVAGIADFDGDYRADVLWRNDDTRGILLWQMDGADVIAAEPIGSVSAAWRVEGLGDFDGDGQADILWRNPGNRNVRIWRMNRFIREAAESIGVVPRTWEVAGVGDFDGDAKADILWRDAETGNTVIWRMDGFTTLAAGSIGAPATVWQVAGTGDFDGDAKADVLWRNTGTGGTIIWRMDGFARLAMGSIGTVNSGWTVVQLRDTNGDDRVDIVWRNAATGGTVIWQMDGFTKTAAQSIGTVNSSWQVE